MVWPFDRSKKESKTQRHREEKLRQLHDRIEKASMIDDPVDRIIELDQVCGAAHKEIEHIAPKEATIFNSFGGVMGYSAGFGGASIICATFSLPPLFPLILISALAGGTAGAKVQDALGQRSFKKMADYIVKITEIETSARAEMNQTLTKNIQQIAVHPRLSNMLGQVQGISDVFNDKVRQSYIENAQRDLAARPGSLSPDTFLKLAGPKNPPPAPDAKPSK